MTTKKSIWAGIAIISLFAHLFCQFVCVIPVAEHILAIAAFVSFIIFIIALGMAAYHHFNPKIPKSPNPEIPKCPNP